MRFIRATIAYGLGIVPAAAQTPKIEELPAPAQGCDAAHACQKARVPYAATYLFLK